MGWSILMLCWLGPWVPLGLISWGDVAGHSYLSVGWFLIAGFVAMPLLRRGKSAASVLA